MKRAAWSLVILVAVSGCYQTVGEADGGDVDDGGGSEIDAGPPPPSDALDVLFVIDDSNSMGEEQVSLRRDIPRMLEILASGDFEGDGVRDFAPYRVIQAGIVSTDMGAGGFTVPTCTGGALGDDGILQTAGDTALGCEATYPAILTWQHPGSIEWFSAGVACVAALGTGGCGFEQQLEAPLKALSPTAPQPYGAPDYVAPEFFSGTPPHGDRENVGLLQTDSLLAVVIVTDEEDCSASDPRLYDPSGPYGDLGTRCFAHPDALQPISRYVEGLLQLRLHPSRLFYAVVAGIPVDLIPAPGDAPDWPLLVSPDPALRDDRMEQRVDETTPTRLLPSCNVPERGIAFPPVRMVQVAQELDARGARVALESICQESMLEGVTRALARAAGP